MERNKSEGNLGSFKIKNCLQGLRKTTVYISDRLLASILVVRHRNGDQTIFSLKSEALFTADIRTHSYHLSHHFHKLLRYVIYHT
jgi:hypothetical protein